MQSSASLKRLMSDYSLRTLDPNKARLFYVPTWLIALYSNTVYDKGVHHFEALVSALSNKSDIFAAAWKTNRSRHLFFLAGDKGVQLVAARTHLFVALGSNHAVEGDDAAASVAERRIGLRTSKGGAVCGRKGI